MKFKRLGFKKKTITTEGSPLLQEHSNLEQNQQVVSWEQAVKAYDKLSIDGFINGRVSGGTTII